MGFDLKETAVPAIDRETCTGCGQCAEVCSSRTLAMEEGMPSVATRMFAGCIGCGLCAAVCPTGSIAVRGRRFELGQLVDLPAAHHRATAEQLDALLLARRSIRQFQEREVDRKLVDGILAMTSTAPMGIPPSEVGIVVFHGREKVRQFAADAIAAFRAMRWVFGPVMLTLMRPLMSKTSYRAMREFVRPLYDYIIDRWDQGEDAFTYDAPLAMLFHGDAMADPADCHIAATYAMIAAQSLGLGSCMLGTTAGLAHAKAFKAKYGIPKANKIGLGLVLGYPEATFQRGIRRNLASVKFA
jgi:ferredoxin